MNPSPIIVPELEPDTLAPSELEAAPVVEQDDEPEAWAHEASDVDTEDEPAAWPFTARLAERARLTAGIRAAERRLRERHEHVAEREATLLHQPENDGAASALDAATSSVTTAERMVEVQRQRLEKFDADTEAMRPELEALALQVEQVRAADAFDVAPVEAAANAIGELVAAARKADSENSQRWSELEAKASALGVSPPHRGAANAAERVQRVLVEALARHRIDVGHVHIWRY